MAIDRWLALGTIEVRIISMTAGERIAQALRHHGWRLTTFQGQGRDGPRTMVYAICPRRDLAEFIAHAKTVDPEIIYSVDPVRQYAARFAPLRPYPSIGPGLTRK
jgi:uncharacterized protein YebE (UPF0316 family)